MITTKRKTIISPRRIQSASPVRIPQNIGRSLLPTINITPLKLSSVSSIRLNGASNCNIFCSSLRIRLSPVKSPIIRKYKIRTKDVVYTLQFQRAMLRVASAAVI